MMQIVLICCMFASSLSSVLDNEVERVRPLNSRPIVGVLAHEFSSNLSEFKNYRSIIPASYVKFLESAGAQVVPIWINQTQLYYETILSQINGALFPGGNANFRDKNGYGEAGAHIYKITKEMNAKGDYFPLWGTCLGFELLAYLGANSTDPLTECSSANVNLNLNFLTGYNSSKMFQYAPQDVIQALKNDLVTSNFHRFCLTQENLTQYMGDENWQVLSLSEDAHGLQFISAIESRNMPVYGVQFHPEKNIFEWIPEQTTAHSFSAIKAAQYFANFFVNETRKNFHNFPSISEEQNTLIYNYQTTYTGKIKHFINEEVYFFK